jgi:hypothetical protein
MAASCGAGGGSDALTSRDRGMTNGQQGTSSTMEAVHAISVICWAACCPGDPGAGGGGGGGGGAWVSSRGPREARPPGGWGSCM